MSAISWDIFKENENKSLPPNTEIPYDKEIRSGDFILTRANTSQLIAKSVVVPDNVREKLLLNDKTLRVLFPLELNIYYVNLYNNCSFARNHYEKVATGTSDSMKNISRENIKMLFYPLPPLQEQHAIVTTVNTLMGLCDALEQELGQQESRVEELMRSCLREVVDGEVLKEELPVAAEEGVGYRNNK